MPSPAVRPAVLFLLFAFALPNGSVAGPVTGRVVDPDGRAIPGARTLVVDGATVLATGVTDARGAFALNVPDLEGLELRIAAEGFRARSVALSANSGTQDAGELTLEISAISESVVVSAAQVEVPLSTTASSVTIVTGAELTARQTETLADGLRVIPGLSVARAGGRGALTSVFPRGGESDYSLVVVDGVPANAFGGGFDFAHLAAVNIDRVEIVRGPQSALYGSNAIGAVVRVVTKRGGPPSAEASVEGGSFGTKHLTAATAGGRGAWQWGASFERLASDGFNGARASNGETIENDDYGRVSGSASAGWMRSNGAAVRANVWGGRDERGVPGPFGSDPGGSFGGIDRVSRGTNERWLASVAGVVPAGTRSRVHAQLAHGRIDGAFVSPFGESDSFSRRTHARLQADIRFADGLDASAGLELQRERAGSTFITAGPNRVDVERGLLGLFAETRWNRSGRLFVTAGVRGERIARDALAGDPSPFAPRPDFGEDTTVSVNPKVAAAWYVRAAGGTFTKLRATAGTGIRPPDGFEIAFSDNPSLKPERSRSMDVGIDQAFFAGRALVEATAFFNEYDDLIIAVGSFGQSSRYRTDNISNARARGVELAGTARTRMAWRQPVDLQIRLAYTRLDTEILAVDRGALAPPPFVAGDPLLRRPGHTVSADVLVQGGPFTGFLQASGRSHVLDVDPSLGTFGGLFDAPGFAVWHGGVSWKIGRHIDVFARIANLFDRSYEEALGYPAPGRGAVAGLRVAAGR
jgi:outer membrane cobalamin receptor